MGVKKKRFLNMTVIYILLVFCTILVVAPLGIMVLGSFKSSVEVTAFDLSLPVKWMFSNYAQVFDSKFLKAIGNSIVITVISVSVNIFLSSLASFILARKKSRMSQFLYYFFFLGSLIPMQTIPTIKIFKMLNIYGTIPNAIIIYIVINLSFACFLYTGFIKGVSATLDEAAFVDGATCFQVYSKIIFPLLKPINITIVIITFMNIWNDINIPLYFLSNPRYWTVPLSVFNYFGKYSGNHWELVFAVLTLTAIPVVILYLIGQRYIVSGLTSGAVKE